MTHLNNRGITNFVEVYGKLKTKPQIPASEIFEDPQKKAFAELFAKIRKTEELLSNLSTLYPATEPMDVPKHTIQLNQAKAAALWLIQTSLNPPRKVKQEMREDLI